MRTRRKAGRKIIYESTWSTWSAVGNLTSRAGELRSAPSGPDDRHRVHLEHLECSYQPHIQGRGAQKRLQRAG